MHSLSLLLLLCTTLVLSNRSSVATQKHSSCSSSSTNACSKAFEKRNHSLCTNNCHTLFLPRSTHANIAYFSSAGLPATGPAIQTQMDIGCMYERSFAADDIATCLAGKPLLIFTGSQSPQRNNNDYLADQFGLSPLFEGSLTLHPTITNYSMHLQASWSEHSPCCDAQGLWVRAQLTVTHQKRSLLDGDCPHLTQGESSGATLPAGEVALSTVPAVATLEQALSGTSTYGSMKSVWSADRFPFVSLSSTQIAGMSFDVGYQVPFYDDTHECTLFVRYRPGVGTAIKGGHHNQQYLFAPIIGSGRHHEIGGGTSVRGELWSDCSGRSITVHAQVYATHLFANHQCRSFDLTDQGCLSRYMLLKTFDKESLQPLGTLLPAMNVTTQKVSVAIPLLAEGVVQCMCTTTHSSFTIGYALYYQSREQLHLLNDPFVAQSVAYGIAGCSGLYNFVYDTTSTGLISSPAIAEPLLSNATGSGTTITSCNGNIVDNATELVSSNTVAISWNNTFVGNGQNGNSVSAGSPLASLSIAHASQPPVILTADALNICSGSAPKQVSNKGFITYTYHWHDASHPTYLSGGISAEGSGDHCSLKQVSIWLQGGCSF